MTETTAPRNPDLAALDRPHPIAARDFRCETCGFDIYPVMGGWRHSPDAIKVARSHARTWPR